MIVSFVLECERLLKMEDVELAAEQWEKVYAPEDVSQFPQALRLANLCWERFGDILHSQYVAEENIRQAEWEMRNPEGYDDY